MIGRRAAVLAGLAAGLPWAARAANPPVPPNGRIAFEAFRNDSRIGTHTLSFSSNGDELSVRIEVRFAVGFGPLTLYRYTLLGTERWSGGRFVALDTDTNDDGTQHKVTVRRVGSGLQVRSSGMPDSLLPAETLPLTHWAVAAMSAPLFNPQDGVPIPGEVTKTGPEMVKFLDGSGVEANGYRLNGKLALQDWYDDAQHWVKLRAKAKDGSDVDYRLV
ncbi:DUF6134 family protein [Acidisphaera sp. L21]|uniref:DUF6134 family protein n=1 Tax=Acidisphaera sp. L21 TaxID=1641851 RepID=UPI00131C48AE|nr:DUF6134 family protein [Acidisphaera sp. L21]